MRVWLLEVNMSSSLACDSPLDQKIKGNLIADIVSLTGIIPLESRANAPKLQKVGHAYGGSSKKLGSRLIVSRDQVRKKVKLSRDETLMLKVLDDEKLLKGHFRRVFPNGNLENY